MRETLYQQEVHGGRVIQDAEHLFRLVLPVLSKGTYGLSQLDDYMHLPRFRFPHKPPLALSLEAKAARQDLCGTWGFGFWNDPFSAGFSAGGMSKWLPVMPNAAWFFFGSPPNHLTLRGDLPGSGFQVKTFRSPLLPSILSLLAVPAVPLLLWRVTTRIMRKFAKAFVQEAAFILSIDAAVWHSYRLVWSAAKVVFEIDQVEVFTTSVSPRGRLGLVIWVDNQYFFLNPDGRLGFGSLPTQEDHSILVRLITLDQIND